MTVSVDGSVVTPRSTAEVADWSACSRTPALRPFSSAVAHAAVVSAAAALAPDADTAVPLVAACVIKAANGWRFPDRASVDVASVAYPFTIN